MDQAEQDRQEKRRYRRWQHADWNDQWRQTIPPPQAEDHIEVRAWGGQIVARHPVITGDLATYYDEPWRLE